MNQPTQFNKRSFGDGFRWVGQSAELLGKGGAPLLTIILIYFLVSLIQWLPGMFGPVLLTIITPLLTAGLLTAFRVIDGGERPQPGMLFAGWRAGVGSRLLVLGVWLLLGVLLAVGALFLFVSSQFDPELMRQLLENPEAFEENPEALFADIQGSSLLLGLVCSFVIFFIVIGGLYFAVPLVHFWERPVGSSLQLSLRAVVGNLPAIIGFIIMMMAILFAWGLMFGLISLIVGLALGPAAELVLQIVMVIGTLFIQLLYAATQWVAFKQIFEGSSPESCVSSGIDVARDSSSDSIEL